MLIIPFKLTTSKTFWFSFSMQPSPIPRKKRKLNNNSNHNKNNNNNNENNNDDDENNNNNKNNGKDGYQLIEIESKKCAQYILQHTGLAQQLKDQPTSNQMVASVMMLQSSVQVYNKLLKTVCLFHSFLLMMCNSTLFSLLRQYWKWLHILQSQEKMCIIYLMYILRMDHLCHYIRFEKKLQHQYILIIKKYKYHIHQIMVMLKI